MEAIEIIEAASSNPLTLAGVFSLIVIAIVRGWLIPLSTFKVLESTWREAIERERGINERLTESLKVSLEQAELNLSLLSKLPRDEKQHNNQSSAEREEER